MKRFMDGLFSKWEEEEEEEEKSINYILISLTWQDEIGRTADAEVHNPR
jgi:hypothetical protein